MTQPPPIRGEVVKLNITDWVSNGDGVGRHNNFAVFVPGALPGETVTARILSVHKRYARAALRDVIISSARRAEPPCPVYGRCGGCQLQHMAYESQLEFKQRQVERALSKIGKLDGALVRPVLGMDEPWAYRNKALFRLAQDRGRLVAGFYGERSHRVVPAAACALQHPLTGKAVDGFLAVASRLKIPVYDPRRRTGGLQDLLVRVGTSTGQIMLAIGAVDSDEALLAELAAGLIEELPELTSILHSSRSRSGPAETDSGYQTLYGSPFITEHIGPYRFRISGASFFQVNSAQTLKLYELVRQFSGLTGQETVLDAYCGTGTIGLFLAEGARLVHGIELVPDAIADARQNAKDNQIANAIFQVGQVESALPELMSQGVQPDIAIVDPPRQGCKPEVLSALAGAGPNKIIYVSCNPATLARDLAILVPFGYQATEVQPVDMFPQTHHVETVVLMSRVEK